MRKKFNFERALSNRDVFDYNKGVFSLYIHGGAKYIYTYEF